ncbi:MAG TPA: D-alanyl-D-alanine carboxypeptidase, partial [Mycobacteriales bacterium]|nr:D-alanyl-D-alanine carboxypeptidase [Mycobacteriales bacterium]
MRDHIRLTIATAVVIVLLAGAGTTYLVTAAHHTRQTERASVSLPRTLPLLDIADGPAPTRVGVSAALRRSLARTGLARSFAGVVVDATTGVQLFADQPARAMPPASTLKLFTAAAALTTLRPNDTLTTGVVRSGNTLYLVGGGDVTLTAKRQPGYPTSATLTSLAVRTATALHGSPRVRLRYDAGGWPGPT